MGHCVPNGRVNVRKYTGAMVIGCRALRKLPALRWEKRMHLNHILSQCAILHATAHPQEKATINYYDARHILGG